MQERRTAGRRESGLEGYRKGAIRDCMDPVLEGHMKRGIQEARDPGLEEFRTRGLQDRRDTGQEGYMTEVYRTGGIQDRREKRQEEIRVVVVASYQINVYWMMVCDIYTKSGRQMIRSHGTKRRRRTVPPPPRVKKMDGNER